MAYLGFCACIFQVRIETYTICLFDSQILFCKRTELRKADRTVGVNYNILSSISSGTAWLLQGMFTTEKRPYNLNNRDESL